MKYYILKHKDNRIDGVYLNGITPNKPIVMIDEEETLDSNYIEVEMEETDDRYINQIFYKVKDSEIVKMSDDEFKTLYPNYGLVVPTEMEISNQRITDQELDALETNQRMTDLELLFLEGGI